MNTLVRVMIRNDVSIKTGIVESGGDGRAYESVCWSILQQNLRHLRQRHHSVELNTGNPNVKVGKMVQRTHSSDISTMYAEFQIEKNKNCTLLRAYACVTVWSKWLRGENFILTLITTRTAHFYLYSRSFTPDGVIWPYIGILNFFIEPIIDLG